MDLPLLDRHRPKCDPPRPARRFRFRALAWIAVHLAVLVHLAHWKVTGSTLTPVEPSEAMQTLELGYLNAGFLLFVVLILATLVSGRWFCGWACHVVAYQDFCAWLLGKAGLRPRPFRSRLLVFVPLGAALYMFAWPTLARMWEGTPAPALSGHFTTESFWRTFPGPGIAVLTFAVDGFLIVWLLGAKGFCTYGCPYGAVFGVADRLAAGRIRVNDACEHCGHCTAVCTSNVRVHEEVARHGMVVDPGCMKCLDCVSVCPKEALSFSFGRPALAKSGVLRNRSVRAWDLSWPAELAIAAVFLGSLLAWRGLYDAVPFLLALGLAAITAFLAFVFARLLRGGDLRVQWLTLRRGGRRTAAGRVALVVLPLVFIFVAHSAWVQWETASGKELLVEGRMLPRPAREAKITAALGHLETAERWGLVPTAILQHYLGNAYRNLDRRGEAEERLRRAVDLDPEFLASRMDLATLLLLRGDAAGARTQVEAVVASKPRNAAEAALVDEARKRLERLDSGAPLPR